MNVSVSVRHQERPHFEDKHSTSASARHRGTHVTCIVQADNRGHNGVYWYLAALVSHEGCGDLGAGCVCSGVRVTLKVVAPAQITAKSKHNGDMEKLCCKKDSSIRLVSVFETAGSLPGRCEVVATDKRRHCTADCVLCCHNGCIRQARKSSVVRILHDVRNCKRTIHLSQYILAGLFLSFLQKYKHQEPSLIIREGGLTLMACTNALPRLCCCEVTANVPFCTYIVHVSTLGVSQKIQVTAKSC